MKIIVLLLLILAMGCQADLSSKKRGDYIIDKVYDADYYFPYKVYPCSMHPGDLKNIPDLNISPDSHSFFLFFMIFSFFWFRSCCWNTGRKLILLIKNRQVACRKT